MKEVDIFYIYIPLTRSPTTNGKKAKNALSQRFRIFESKGKFLVRFSSSHGYLGSIVPNEVSNRRET